MVIKMIYQELIEHCDKQRGLCKEQIGNTYLKKSDFYKEKYINLISVILSSAVIVLSVIFASIRTYGEVQVLKNNVKQLEKL